MKRSTSFGTLFTCMLLIGAPSVSGATFYVSPTGDDKHDGSIDAPVATLPRALEIVRAGAPWMEDVTILLADGTYVVEETIKLTPGDNPVEGFRLTIRGESLAGAVLTGGPEVPAWQNVGGNVYRAQIGSGRSLHTLYEDGERADLARFPNRESRFPLSRAGYLKADVGTDRLYLQWKDGDFDPTGLDLSKVQIYGWNGVKRFSRPWRAWVTYTVPVASIDVPNRTFHFADNASVDFSFNNIPTEEVRYLIQNSLALLDAPGEFFYDRDSGYLYYYPRELTIAEQEIVFPLVRTLVEFVGNETTPVRGIDFEYVAFRYTDHTDYHPLDWWEIAENQDDGAIILRYAEDIVFDRVFVSGTGFSGISLLDAAQNVTIQNSAIERTGVHGVLLKNAQTQPLLVRDNRIHNNRISHIGELAGYAAGVHILNSGYTTVTHNEISHSVRYAVAWRHARRGTGADLVIGNYIAYNEAFQTCQDSGDTAPFYTVNYGNASVRNVVEQNLAYNIWADESLNDRRPDGYYNDQVAYHNTWRNNDVWNVQNALFKGNGDLSTVIRENNRFSEVFDDSLIDYANIGLTEDFPPAYRNTPYPPRVWRNGEFIAYDGFERDDDEPDESFGWADSEWHFEGAFRERKNDNQLLGDYSLRVSGGSGLNQATRTVDLAGRTNVRLQFHVILDSVENSDRGYVDVFDGEWHTIYTVTPELNYAGFHFIDLDLSGFNMIDGFKIRFREDFSSRQDYWNFDEIYVVDLDGRAPIQPRVAIVPNGSNFIVVHETVPGQIYQLQSSRSGEVGSWEPVGSPVAGDGNPWWSGSVGGEDRMFYRVETWLAE